MLVIVRDNNESPLIKGLLLIKHMLFPVILDDFIAPIRPWDIWLEEKIAISQEVMNKETEPRVQEMTIEEHIVYYAKKNWAPVHLALKIAHCESWLNPNAKNKTSSAWGIFQFIDSTWKSNSKFYWRSGANKYDAESNIDIATKKIAREWTNARKASSHCWNK